MSSLLAEPAVRVFAFWYLILVLKMLAVVVATSLARFRTGTFATPEDYAAQGVTAPQGATTSPEVERVRRCLQNDLENILPFFGVGLIYASTGPSLTLARIYFAGFAVARIAHTVAYLRGMQPHRTIAFGVAQLFLLLMLVTALWTVL
jgi:uncharacterized MAPEG superfamily protein